MKIIYVFLTLIIFVHTSCLLPSPHAAAPLAVRPLDVRDARTPAAPLVQVVDGGDQLLVVTQKGATLYRAGVAVATEERAFVAASTLPAADGNGRWLVAIDGDGVPYRLRVGAPSERIGARYGIDGGVRALCQAGDQRAVFAVGHELVVADGAHVKHYPLDLPGPLRCGGNRVAARSGDTLHVFDTVAATVRDYVAPDATFALDAQGALWALTPRALYRALPDGNLQLFYRPADGALLHGLVVAGRRLWLGEGDRLTLVEGELVARTMPLRLDHPALTAGSPSGDVWVTTTGRLQRLTRDDGALLPDERWAQQMAPIFARSCSTCHLPTGRAGLDLSTAAAWDGERDVIRERVVDKRTMPPTGSPLAEEDRQAIARWLDGG